MTVKRMNELMIALAMGKQVKTKNREELKYVIAIEADVKEILKNGKELIVLNE